MLQLALRVAQWLARVMVGLLGSTVRLRQNDEPPDQFPGLDCPVVLIAGNMGDAAKCAGELRARGIRAIDASLGPVSSCHDRACELFFALKGGRVDYGAEHSEQHGHSRFGQLCDAQHQSWSASRPVLLLCHSQGANTALALVELLERGAFASVGHATSSAWVRGICTIASPLAGVAWMHSLAGVPPPSSACGTCQRVIPAACLASGRAAKGGTLGPTHEAADQPFEPRTDQPHDAQSVGTGLVAFVITAGYVLDILLGWSSWFTRHVWDWRIGHWRLGLRDVMPLVRRRHRLQLTTDTALYDLTPAGAHANGLKSRAYRDVLYVAIPCCITSVPSDAAEDACDAQWAPVPCSTAARPFHVAFAALGAATAPRPCCRHSDGLVPSCAQHRPPLQPHCYLDALAPPCAESARQQYERACRLLRDPQACAARRATLRGELVPGVWCSSARMWALDHSASQLQLGSAALAWAMQVVLPAMCERAAEDARSLAEDKIVT